MRHYIQILNFPWKSQNVLFLQVCSLGTPLYRCPLLPEYPLYVSDHHPNCPAFPSKISSFECFGKLAQPSSEDFVATCTEALATPIWLPVYLSVCVLSRQCNLESGLSYIIFVCLATSTVARMNEWMNEWTNKQTKERGPGVKSLKFKSWPNHYFFHLKQVSFLLGGLIYIMVWFFFGYSMELFQ